MTSYEPRVEHLDVLIVGAGISGIGAGRYLRLEHPGRSFAILEARGASGGTWDLFRYPGVRSDSDLYTFGYAFKPWRDRESIATGSRVLSYLRETVTENGLDAHIRYHHKVLDAHWSSDRARWTVRTERTDPETGAVERVDLTAGWIFCATGYYRYDEGHTPRFEGRDRFRGRIVHPQHWPEDLDHRGKRVVVIGSGATAVTLVPAMAEETAHVTMLQRTPTYIVPVPKEDRLARLLRGLLGDERGHALSRRKNIVRQQLFWRLSRRHPTATRKLIRAANARLLPAGFPVDEHFSPPYDPWDQRLCAAPGGDLFKAIGSGRASVVTDRIATFTEDGILLASGRELPADVIVTATGLDLRLLGGIRLTVDGTEVSPADSLLYRGTMLSGVPNLNLAIGYTHASWTLKIGLLCAYVCRLLAHMDRHGHDTAWPESEPGLPTRPMLDFGAGYVRRALDHLPRQGPEAPWATSTSYHGDRRLLRQEEIADGHLRFSGPATRAATAPAPDRAAPVPDQAARAATAPVPDQAARAATAPVPDQAARAATAPVPDRAARAATAPDRASVPAGPAPAPGRAPVDGEGGPPLAEETAQDLDADGKTGEVRYGGEEFGGPEANPGLRAATPL
ncbi:flavin-containing monooxygenase [Streptomyces omiyaensis]|uniref:flavin-containing monooxygenase n=1 Tax=Streptomyces omiyaensis TaxID=68247 RepID=UPI0016736E34|nr:NAD(P)/FAD-dependent oxidoreductase [Streptomyces omiyaensis]